MNILFLTLKAYYFDEIALGKKTIEYRDISPYFTARLIRGGQFIKYDAVLFQNGYSLQSRRMLVTHAFTEKTDCYEIHLGAIIEPPYITINGQKINKPVNPQHISRQKRGILESLKTYSM
jgi:hypothetical protein